MSEQQEQILIGIGKPEKTVDTIEHNKDVLALKDLFGDDAVIESIDQGFHISSTLKDAICEGGQKIDLTVGKRITKQKLEIINDPKNSVNIDGYEVKHISVNGRECLPDLHPIFFEAREFSNPFILFDSLAGEKATPADILEANRPRVTSLQYDRLRQAGTGAVNKTIFITSLQTIEDLIAILHENGHLNDDPTFDAPLQSAINRVSKSVYAIQSVSQDQILKNIFGKEPTPQMKPEISETLCSDLIEIMQSEVRANIHAFNLLKRWNSDTHLFSTDSEYMRVKKFFTTQLLGYTNYQNGVLRPYLSDEEQEKLFQLTRIE